MALIDGDDFVSGDIVSFQEENRIKNHWVQADPQSNLGNPQEGMIVYDSDDGRLYLRRASDFADIWTPDAPYPWANLLMNSGFGVWSQSDASKGLATITYDSGGNTALVVGETLTGNTSGATCKVISYTTASGTWAGGNAAGVITVGACSHDFAWVDNETVTGSAAGADAFTVNMPDSAVQVGLIQNGGFNTDTDPPPGWTVVNGTISTEAGGEVGNCMKLLNGGAGNSYCWQVFTTVVGKIYKLSVWAKDIDTGTNGLIEVGTAIGQSAYYSSGAITDDAWTQYTITFEATTTTSYITVYCTSAGGAYYFDEITAYEITPCATAADTVAMDGWIKDSTADIYREHSGANVQDGSFYANKLVVTAAADYVRFPGAVFDNEEWYMQFQGRTVTWGKWVKTSTASHARLAITDSAGTTYSSYHTGGGAYEWLEVTRVIDAGATSVAFYVYGDVAPNVNGDTIIYHCQGMIIFGSQIGEGNYAPKSQEFIWLEKNIPSNVYDGLLNQSDLAFTDLNLEADSDAMLPKGAKVIAVHTEIDDSGSGAGLDIHLELRKDATAGTFFCNSVAGKPNDVHAHAMGLQPCDVNGDVDIHLDASGASTLDINMFEYHGVQVN